MNYFEFDYNDPFKSIARYVKVIGIAIVLIVLVCKCFYLVNEQQNAVVTQFGKMVTVETAGFHGKAPWQSVKKVDMTTHGIGIGYSVDGEGQNIQTNEDGIMITKDFNLLNIDFYAEYRVTDPVAYLYNSSNPEEIFVNVARSCIRTVVSNYTIDEAMTTGKNQIQADVKAMMIEELAERNIGLSIINITVQDSEAPTEEIRNAFKSVEDARQGASTAMNEALKYQNSEIPAAQANADNIVQQAEATKNARIAEAQGQVKRFNEIYAEYLNFPDVTKKRLFYEMIEEVFPKVKIIITDGETQTVYPMAPFATGTNTTPTTTVEQ